VRGRKAGLGFAVLGGAAILSGRALNNSRRRRGITVSAIDEAVKRWLDETGGQVRAEIMVVIAAYNEAGSLARVLERIPARIRDKDVKVLVVVDGATDETEQVARQFCVPAVMPIRRGQGAALRAGYAIAVASGADVVAVTDADGQTVPEELPRLVEPILDNEADFVNGSRVLGEDQTESAIRAAGVVFFARLISSLANIEITDTSSPFRAVRGDIVRRLSMRQDQFQAPELLLRSLRAGARFTEVPITFQKRQAGRTKKPMPIPYALGYLRSILRSRFL
jgi:glycosyltransferase involved in cell wall biosynthesis